MVNYFTIESLADAGHLGGDNLVKRVILFIYFANSFLLLRRHRWDGRLARSLMRCAILFINVQVGDTFDTWQSICTLMHLLIEGAFVDHITDFLRGFDAHLRLMLRLQVELLQECLHVGGFLIFNLLHLIQTLQRGVEARIEHWVTPEHQLNSWLEGELVQAKVPQECRETELDDVCDLGVREDKDLVGRPLDGVIAQQVFEQFQSNLGLELLLEHPVEDEIEDGEHR